MLFNQIMKTVLFLLLKCIQQRNQNLTLNFFNTLHNQFLCFIIDQIKLIQILIYQNTPVINLTQIFLSTFFISILHFYFSISIQMSNKILFYVHFYLKAIRVRFSMIISVFHEIFLLYLTKLSLKLQNKFQYKILNMQQLTSPISAQIRKKRIETIKGSLRKIPIISKNSLKIQEKIKTTNDQDESSSATKNSHNGDESTPMGLMDIKEGSLFDEKYEILEKIGEGANGFVNKCRKIKTQTIYAVKSVMMDEQHVIELKNNFLTIKALRHPNIVQYKALYIDMRKKLCYIVMQYINLPSLDKIKIHNQQQLKQIIYQLLDSLKYLHDRNISHRDIKPQNILYDAQNRKIKIIDFGTSKKYIRRNTKFDMLTITGTLFYRAPEMFSGGGYDEKVDIWSVGILLYKLVCGKTPFESPYLSDTINKIKDNSPGFTDDIWLKTDNIIKNLIKRMLKKDPHTRLSANQLLRDVWFYSITFIKLTDLSRSYQQIRRLKNISNNPWKPIQLPLSKINIQKQCTQPLSHIIKKVDGQDYHLIDSEQQDENQCRKNISNSHNCTFSQHKKMKRRMSNSMIL